MLIYCYTLPQTVILLLLDNGVMKTPKRLIVDTNIEQFFGERTLNVEIIAKTFEVLAVATKRRPQELVLVRIAH